MRERVEIMYEVATGALESRALSELVARALAGLAELIPAWRHSVGILDVEGDSYVIYDATGSGAQAFHPGAAVALDSFGGDLIRLGAGQVDLVQDVRAPDAPVGAAGRLTESPLRGQLLTPILHKGALIGTLNIGSDTPDFFTEEHVGICRELAELLARAIGQLQLKDELAEAHEEARRASEAKSVFLAQMSHELRTPLNAILGYSELLVEDAEESGRDGADLLRIRSAAGHLLGLINDILDLAKVESGVVDVTLACVALRPLFEAVAGQLDGLVAEGGNTLELCCAEGLCARADPRRLRQVLINLVGNAGKFTEGGRIALVAEARGAGSVLFEVRDTGRGIESVALEGLFDPFTQAHRDAKGVGTGLGLAISRRLVEMMSGRLEVRSAVGVGTVFSFSLARAQAAGRQ